MRKEMYPNHDHYHKIDHHYWVSTPHHLVVIGDNEIENMWFLGFKLETSTFTVPQTHIQLRYATHTII
jgi:hypothetical protein